MGHAWGMTLVCTGAPLLSGDVINDAEIKEKRLSAPLLSCVLMCRSCYALIMDTDLHYCRCLPRNWYKPLNQHWHCAVVWQTSEWENSTMSCSFGCLRTWELGLGEPWCYPIIFCCIPRYDQSFSGIFKDFMYLAGFFQINKLSSSPLTGNTIRTAVPK